MIGRVSQAAEDNKGKAPQKITSRVLNGIEHLEVSPRIQATFSRALLAHVTASRKEYDDDGLFQAVVECLSGWSRGFPMILESVFKEPEAVGLSPGYLYAISDRIPDAEKNKETRLPAPSVAAVATEALLDETQELLRRLGERGPQKKVCVEADCPAWRIPADWAPGDLGAPVHFIGFLQYAE